MFLDLLNLKNIILSIVLGENCFTLLCRNLIRCSDNDLVKHLKYVVAIWTCISLGIIGGCCSAAIASCIYNDDFFSDPL